MNKQTVIFYVTKDTIGKGCIYQPKVQFKGGTIKWYEDKRKKKGRETK